MTFYILLALSSFLLTLLGTRVTIITLRQRVRPIDPASIRAGYKKPPLTGGGVAVVMALIICMLVADIDYSVILAMFLLAATAMLGELIDIPLPVRLGVQLLSVMIGMHGVALPSLGGLLPLWLCKTLIAGAWIWFINLFDLMDGVDGISPTEMVGIGMGICLIGAMSGHAFPDPLSTYALIVGASGCGFLWWNWHPAKILLGETGAAPIGFLLGYLLLLAAVSGYPYAALILPAYHVSDATITLIRRMVKSKTLRGRGDYYYMRGMRAGRQPDAVVRYIFGVNFLLINLAVFSVLDPELAVVYVGLAYATVFMILGFFAHTQHDPAYEPF